MRGRFAVAVLIGLLALGVGGAARVSAAEAPSFFTAASFPVSFTATDIDDPPKWKLGGYVIGCDDLSLTGSAAEESVSLELKPVYGGCAAFGLPVTVAMNGCVYRFRLWPGPVDGGTVSLKCPKGKEVAIVSEFGICAAHIAPVSESLSFAAYDLFAHPDLRINMSMEGLTAKFSNAGPIFCDLPGDVEVKGGTYFGPFLLDGSSTISVR